MKKYLKCYKDNKLIFSKILININNKSIKIDDESILYTDNENLNLFKLNLDQDDKNYHQKKYSGTNITLAKGDDFLLYYDDKINELVCDGAGLICTTKPIQNVIESSIFNLYANGGNACIIYKLPYSDSKLTCWGDKSTRINDIPDNLQKIDHLKYRPLIAMGRNSVCAVYTEMKIYTQCWGLGTIGTGLAMIPERVKREVVLKLSVGRDHACVLILNQNLFCWGNDQFGQTTIPINYQDRIVDFEAGDGFTCVFKKLVSIPYCWGMGFVHKINKQNYVFDDLKNIALQIGVGGRHSCMARYDDHYECWGNNEYGQTQIVNSHFNRQNDHLYTNRKSNKFNGYGISTGWDFTCYINQSRLLDCIGFNYYDQTDVPVILNKNEVQVVQVDSIHNVILKKSEVEVVEVDSRLNHSCAKYLVYGESKYQLTCWGGTNEHNYMSITNKLIGKNVHAFSVGHDFTCAASIYSQDNLFMHCAGNNDQGQIMGDDAPYPSIEFMSAGGAHICVTKYSNASFLKLVNLNCWGSNKYGQISTPKEYKWAKGNNISASDSYTCAVNIDFSIICWGMVQFFNSDIKIEALSVATNYESMCWVDKQSDNVKCIGDNEWGQCQVPIYGYGLITDIQYML